MIICTLLYVVLYHNIYDMLGIHKLQPFARAWAHHTVRDALACEICRLTDPVVVSRFYFVPSSDPAPPTLSPSSRR